MCVMYELCACVLMRMSVCVRACAGHGVPIFYCCSFRCGLHSVTGLWSSHDGVGEADFFNTQRQITSPTIISISGNWHGQQIQQYFKNDSAHIEVCYWKHSLLWNLLRPDLMFINLEMCASRCDMYNLIKCLLRN